MCKKPSLHCIFPQTPLFRIRLRIFKIVVAERKPLALPSPYQAIL